MEAKISVKIKVAKGKEITLDADEAKELYIKLKEVFEEKVTYIPYWQDPFAWKPYIPNIWPYWSTTAETATLTYSTDKNQFIIGNNTVTVNP